jgi:glycogen(starch) synthase
VGGIYTVLRSKAPSMQKRWRDRYCLVGPFESQRAQVEFEAQASPLPQVQRAVQELHRRGIGVHSGRWLVSGRPSVLLLDYRALWPQIDRIKYQLWEDHAISSPAGNSLLDEALLFGEACRQLLMLLTEPPPEGASTARETPQVIAHCHEWLAGSAIPSLRRDRWPGTIVFTTHATLLGRYLATSHPHFYERLERFDAEREAKRFDIETQHRIERAAAHGAQVFTTVSDVTASECDALLGRKPDLILPNGLNVQRFAVTHEAQTLHLEFKKKINEFVIGHFFPSYSFDLDQTLYFFTSGRYEYRNKGMDLTLEALARLNYRLKVSKVPVTIVFFLITKAQFRSINVRALQSRASLNEFRQVSQAITRQLGETLFLSSVSGQIPDLNGLVDEYWRLRLRRSIRAWRTELPPGIVTHDLIDDVDDPVLMKLRECGLFNHQDDRVKVVYHPDFITETSPLWGIDYEQFVRGCHLGIFPSYYEPWGYTPLESAALGIPAITSDLAGFGSYLTHNMPGYERSGVGVIHRRHRNFDESAEELTDKLYGFCLLTRRQRVALRNRVEGYAEHFDWQKLADHYDRAHELAAARTHWTALPHLEPQAAAAEATERP